MSDRLNEIRARLDAATAGPWRVIEPLSQTHRPPRRMLVADLEAAQQSSEIGNVQMSWFDTRFIAHAPADIAWLLRQVANERADNALHEDDIYDLRDQVNALWDIVHEQDIPGVLDLYEERLKAQRRMRRPHGD